MTEALTAVVDSLVDALAAAPPAVVALVAALLAGGESVLGIGYVVPGEVSVVVAAGLLAHHDVAVLLWLLVTVGAAGGDSLGWLVGRRAGPALHRSRLVGRLGRDRWERAGELVRRRGARAVVVGRFLPVVRAMVPAVAGAAGMRYRTFAPASLVGAALQSALLVTVGTLLGAAVRTAWPAVQDDLATVAWALVAVLVVVAAVLVPREERHRPGPGRADVPGRVAPPPG